ncbi:MAG: ABC transporter substrate-binding protein/permease [Isosphaeraceae bacterium]|nr:ABC transporter substrate-binding protein/permease [Isosphaeraceae bacterium]
MEEDAGAPARANRKPTDLSPTVPPHGSAPSWRPFQRIVLAARVSGGVYTTLSCGSTQSVDTLARVKRQGVLRYGSDKEGGGPYAFPNPESPREVTGFEVELMEAVGRDLGAKPVFAQGQWDRLLQELTSYHVDAVVNGYEWTETRARDYLATRPYYVYQLQLLARKGGPIGSWKDLTKPNPRGRPWTVGVLVSSAADTFANEQGSEHVRVVHFDGATDAMIAVQNGQCDATLQDLPAALFYRDRFPALGFAGEPIGHGYYVIFVRRDDVALRDAIDRSLQGLIDSGSLRKLYERYGLWNDAQDELSHWTGSAFALQGTAPPTGLSLVWRYRTVLFDASLVTIVLSMSSMPLAMLIGLAVALGRLYGPRSIQVALGAYVEFLRGTPLMLQLYVLFYVLRLPPWIAGIGGLAINYSAYEAEIYRAGLQAIPTGQMEAALALGMSRWLALRRVIIPQAVRIVIPPVTNDFIALFKDTSVCSVITLVELTKQYSILANSTGGVLEFALAACVLYLAMSIPLSWFSRWSERRLAASGVKGGLVA